MNVAVCYYVRLVCAEFRDEFRSRLKLFRTKHRRIQINFLQLSKYICWCISFKAKSGHRWETAISGGFGHLKRNDEENLDRKILSYCSFPAIIKKMYAQNRKHSRIKTITRCSSDIYHEEIVEWLKNQLFVFQKLFGLALLITSSMYLKKLNNWAEWNSCVATVTEDVKCNADILCSNLKYWRAAAIIGIVIVISCNILTFSDL